MGLEWMGLEWMGLAYQRFGLRAGQAWLSDPRCGTEQESGTTKGPNKAPDMRPDKNPCNRNNRNVPLPATLTAHPEEAQDPPT